jgi:hypothetical protein
MKRTWFPPPASLDEFLGECRRSWISPEEVLEEAEIPAGRLRAWQASRRIPLRSRLRVADCLWYLELQKELRQADIQQCSWCEEWRARKSSTGSCASISKRATAVESGLRSFGTAFVRDRSRESLDAAFRTSLARLERRKSRGRGLGKAQERSWLHACSLY